MHLSEDKRALVWLSCAEVTAQRVHHLINKYGSPAEIRRSFGTDTGPKFQSTVFERLKKLRSEAALDDMLGQLENRHVKLLFSEDKEYPALLRAIDDFPYLLYYAGRLECLQAPAVALVGTRNASSYGKGVASAIARDLANAGVTVVSGLARGIDKAAHTGALEAEGSTVGVLGSGINLPYPPENAPLLRRIAAGKGLILTEYPLDAEPLSFHFPYRNRIISGISLATVFVEGAVRSGGMHTVNSALTQGREVFAVPGLVGSVGAEGPHAILREGARIVTCAGDILNDLGLPEGKTTQSPAEVDIPDPLQREIVRLLRKEPLSVEQLSETLHLKADELLSQLTIMEISGFVTREAGNLFLASV